MSNGKQQHEHNNGQNGSSFSFSCATPREGADMDIHDKHSSRLTSRSTGMMPTTGTPPNGASRAPPVLQLTGVTNIKRNEHKTQEILRSRFGPT